MQISIAGKIRYWFVMLYVPPQNTVYKSFTALKVVVETNSLVSRELTIQDGVFVISNLLIISRESESISLPLFAMNIPYAYR